MKKILPKTTHTAARMLLVLFVMLTGTQLAGARPQIRFYVTPAGAGSKGGGSWANAMDSIAFRTSLSTIASGDTVWVAAGTYHPNLSSAGNTFSIPSGVKVYGGFNGTETNVNQRNVRANRTILDGAGFIHSVVHFSHVAATTVLDGFTISNGNSDTHGGGIFNDASSGAASSPTLANDSFVNNHAAVFGGAIFNYAYGSKANPVITNCSFVNNSSADNGGAMYNWSEQSGGVSSPIITNCLFSGNTATSGGAAIFNDGHAGTSSPAITNCIFNNNSSATGAGALYNDGNAGVSSPMIENCIFNGNSGTNGGAIDNDGYQGISNPAITNCLFINNTATDGGAMYNSGNTGSSTPAITNCTFYNNTSTASNVIHNDNGATATMVNCIMWDGGTESYNANGGTAIITYSDIEGGYTGANNINKNPKFVSGTNFQLTSTSPCINTGNNAAVLLSTDLAGNTRVQQTTVDMGAYESPFAPVPTRFYVTPAGAGTLSGSSWANAMDSITFRNSLGTTPYGDTIWVAAGTYHPDLSNSNNTFSIPSGVAVYGGFNGTETALNQRNAATNITILSGGQVSLGVVAFNYVDSTTVLDGCTITGGNGGGGGGGNYGGGIYVDGSNSGSSHPQINKCSITNNVAGYGGGIFIDGSNGGNAGITITNSIISNNTGGGNGGGIYVWGASGTSTAVITNCAFQGNSTNGFGGGIFNDGNTGICTSFITNCTFNANTAYQGGGILNLGGDVCNVSIINTIAWGNTNNSGGSDISDRYTSSTVSYSNVAGGWGGNGNNNINADPLFINAATGNLQILTCSPAFNAGTSVGAPSTDILGNTRPALGGYDMGAYEMQTLSPSDTAKFITGTLISNSGNDTLKVALTGNGPWTFAYTDGSNTYGPVTTSTTPYSLIVAPHHNTVYTLTSLSETGMCARIGTPSTDTVKVVLPTHFYVTPGGAGTLSGSSWANAMDVNTFSNNLPATPYGDTFWVAAGAYSGYQYIIPSGVKIYGGFNGTETTFNQRNVHANITDLDGGASFNVVSFTNVDSTTTIDGFTISNGYNDYGGGVINEGGNGGVSNPIIANDSFIDNYARFGGGAIYNTGNSGGNVHITVRNCRFTINAAGNQAGAIFNDGSYSGVADANISDCIFTSNSSGGNGGALLNWAYNGGTSNATVTNTIFIGNTAVYGAAVYNDGEFTSNVSSYTNCTFENNTTSAGIAGAILNQAYGGSVTITVTNCILWDGGAEIADIYGAASTVMNSDVQGGWSGNGTNNINASPLFINANNGNLQITSCSPAFNTGTAVTFTTDLLGNPRTNIISGYDMGAYSVQTILPYDTAKFITGTIKADGSSDTLKVAFTGAGPWTFTYTDGTNTYGPDTAYTSPYKLIVAPISYTIYTLSSITEPGMCVKTGTPSTDTVNVLLPTHFYVTTTGAGDLSGGSWANAMNATRFYQNLHIIPYGDTIWVAAGTYQPDLSNNSNTFYIPSGVKVYGGFAGTETTLNQRTNTNTTILDGGSGSVFHVVTLSYVDNTTILDGFTIQGGNCIGGYPDNTGGGVLIDGDYNGNSSPTVNNCIIQNNAGNYSAAMFITGYDGGSNNSTITNCSFINNSTLYSGGAVYIYGEYGDAQPTITNCVFDGNSASYGAAIYNDGGGGNASPLITNCTFSRNTSAYNVGVYYEYGTSILTNCILWDNASLEIGNYYAVTVNYTDIYGGWSGTGNINADPLFINTGSNNLQITSCSPAFNAATAIGAPATDILGNPRPALGGYDMGAYEAQTLAPTDTAKFITGTIVSSGGNKTLQLGFTGAGPWIFTYTDGTNIFGPDTAHTSPYSIVVAPIHNTVYTISSFSVTGACYVIGSPATDTVRVPLPTHCYVTMRGAGTNHGDSWANAMDSVTFRTNLSYAVYGDTFWIAAGKYHPDLSNSANTFNILSGVKLYGGFTGSETLLSQRNIHTHRTILDGAGIISSVVYFNHVDSTTTIDGFIIAHGNNTGGAYNLSAGAGIFNDGSGSGSSNPLIVNDSLTNNSAGSNGGAIYNYAESNGTASPTISHCTFTNNYSSNEAGAIYSDAENNGLTNMIITDCIFKNNRSGFAVGAILNDARNGLGNIVITNCVFMNNTATSYVGALLNADCNVSITNCTFTGNTASGGFGVIYDYQLGSIISNCILWDGNANEIFDIGASTTVNNSDIYGGWSGAGGNNISTNPQFISSTNFQLKSTSPCVNTGSNTFVHTSTDLAGALRIQRGVVDMGAYESSYGPCPTITVAPTPAVTQICSGASVVYTTNAIPGVSTYQWQYIANNDLAANNQWHNFGVNDTTATLNGTAQKTYTRLVISTPGCPTVSSLTAVITIDSTSLQVTASALTSRSAQLNWNLIDGANYTIMVNGNTYTSNTNSYILTGLSACTTYNVSVTANGATCGGIPSGNAVIITPPAALTLSLNAGSSSSIAATWTAGVGPYKLYYGIEGSNNYTAVSVSNTGYTIAKPQGGQSYIAYVVDLGSTCSPRAQSNYAYYNTPGGTCAMAAPLIVSASSTATSFTISWSGSSSQYEIIYRKLSAGNGIGYSTTNNSYTVNGLSPNSCYVYCIANRCGSSYGYATQMDTICTPALCTAPLNLELSAITCHGFTSTWNSVAGALYYSIFYTHNNSTASYRSSTNSSVFTLASPGTAYTVSVKAICTTGGQSASSNVESVSTLLTGCKDGDINTPVNNANAVGMSIYPNPNNGNFTVSVTSANTKDVAKLQVINLLGEVMVETEIANNNGLVYTTVNNTNLAAGVYLMRVQIGDETHLARVVISQ